MLGNFIYSKSKDLFLQELEAGNVLDEAIVFIEDTKEIWNHGTYFDGKNIDLTNYETVEESVLKLSEAKTYTDEQIELYHSATLTIDLIAGTKWVSFYVQTTLEEVQTALGTNGMTITTSYDGGTTLVTSTYDSETNTWSGDLTELDFTKMYQIACSADCSITLFGKKVGNIEITLNSGWNWIGYPLYETVEINDALANLTNVASGDEIKSLNNGYAQYSAKLKKWSGTLSTLTPGEGYMYNNKSDVTKTLTFPTEDEILKLKLSQKLDIISDLDTIREGSILGATAVNDTINSFDTKVVTLKLHLPKGYKWVSFYVNITLEDLYSALGTNGISISTTSAGGMSEADLINTYDSSTNSWSGNITELDFSKMYIIETSSECDIYLTGEQINPADLSITLQTGWNYVGYPLSKEVNINDAFANTFVPTEGEVIKCKDQTSIYYGTWVGSVQNMIPGQGYMFNSVDNKTLIYPDTYYKPFGNVEVSSELGESTTKAASLDLVTKVSEESKQYVNDKIDNLNKVTQIIDLVSGYNWFSSYVKITTEDLLSALGTSGKTVVSGDWSATYYTSGWDYDSHTFDYSKMYMIETSEACTIELYGELLNPEDILITLEPGWNNIGYPSNVGVDINSAFNFKDGKKPAEGDVIKSQNNGSADYAYGQWWGTLSTMVPGVGYQYQSNASSETKTFTFPTELDIALSKKQDTLVSGTNIKTINGTSILGSGNVSTAYPQVDHGTSDTTFTLTPNVLHVWKEVTELNLDFAEPTEGIVNEYTFEFYSGAGATTLTLPDSITWAGGTAPTIESLMMYQISIVNNLATILNFPGV